MKGHLKSLRRRLVWGVTLTTCLMWGSVAAWQFTSMQREMRSMLDERLIASAKMVAAIVEQIHPDPTLPIAPAKTEAMNSLIARDGVECEVSLVRSEVDVLPIARTGNAPDLNAQVESGFGSATKGGKPWRTYVLEYNGMRVVTADRMDVREHLVATMLRALVLPFVLTLAGIALMTWWIYTRSLRPLESLRRELSARPPHDPSPVRSGQDVAEISPLVQSLNALLARINASVERERRWTANAAHELRTPLTGIKTHVQVAQLAMNGEPGAPKTDIAIEALHNANTGVQHLQSTLEQLLQLARVESAVESGGSATMRSSADDIVQAFQHACEQSAARARTERVDSQASVEQRIEPDAADPRWARLSIPLAPALLVSAITNLTDNALLHQHSNTAVQATLALVHHEQRDWLEVRIRDHGPGMATDEIELSTQRFWRKGNAAHGSGLGLTIVQHIAEIAGGELLMRPEEPGLTAILRLPSEMSAR